MAFPFRKYPCAPIQCSDIKEQLRVQTLVLLNFVPGDGGKKGQNEAFKKSLTMIVDTFCSPLEITHPQVSN